ncbi:MAG: PRC-barrel domain-containing protein, partial [Hyphomicrobiales bacterium]|nr:PRC-barrel domain-containing protein [Hyphomicrobiales bacterium]
MSVIAAVILAGAAFAQDTTQPVNSPQPVPSAAPNFITLDNSSDMLSSNIVGLDVRNDQNASIGKIQDIAFDNSKALKGYILSVGGFLGIGT